MIKSIKEHLSGFYPMCATDKWQVAYITYSDAYGDLKELKRHMTTDEVIIPVLGNSTLYTYENDKVVCMELCKNVVYNIEKGTWHHLKISRDALLIVVEDSNITKQSTERMTIDANCRIYKTQS